MPFIKEPLDDVHEPEAAPEARYDVRIVKAVPGEDKGGNSYIRCMCVLEDGEVDAPPFSHFIFNWDGDAEEDMVRMRKLEVKRFCAAFGLPEDFELEDLVGATASQILVVQREDDRDGTMRNEMRLPYLKE